MTAYNIYGYGYASNTTTIIPTDVPSKVAIPTVVISTVDVLISWTAPNDHHATIDSYEIQFLTMSGSFVTDNNDCNGASPTIVAATDCLVPMTSILYLT